MDWVGNTSKEQNKLQISYSQPPLLYYVAQDDEWVAELKKK